MQGPGHCGLCLLPALSPSPDKDTSPGCDPSNVRLCLSLMLKNAYQNTDDIIMGKTCSHFQKHKPFASFSASCCCSVTQLCPTLCDSMDCSVPGLPVPHHLPEFAQVHVQCIGDAMQPSHTLTPSSPSALHLSQHQGLFQ